MPREEKLTKQMNAVSEIAVAGGQTCALIMWPYYLHIRNILSPYYRLTV